MSALAFRRIALIVAPLVAAVLIVVGVFLDPDIDASGRELAQEYADNPGVTQLSASSFHFAFVVWAPVVFALVGLVRGQGAWLANVAAVLAVLGATTLPGFLIVDSMTLPSPANSGSTPTTRSRTAWTSSPAQR